jgi:hypothetical protein
VPLWQKSVSICVHPWLNPEIAKRTQFQPQLFGHSKDFKAFQRDSKLFKGLGKLFLFSAATPVATAINPNQPLQVQIQTKYRPILAEK